MNDLFSKEEDLRQYFSTKNEMAEFLLLKYLMQSKEPMGSWMLKIMLDLKGVDLSTATIGRILKNFDTKKYTKLVDNQGRVLTAQGAAHVQMLSDEIRRTELQKQLIHAAQPKSFRELIDLFQARAVIERETSRLAALNASPRQMDAIRMSMKRHEECVERNEDPTGTALQFHEMVAEASHNRFLKTTLDILIFEELQMESQIADMITKERGAEYAQQHQLIAQAIFDRDPVSAQKFMALHMDTLLAAMEEQVRLLEEKQYRQEVDG